ncbi:MAG TPA: porin [Pseudomonadales bacterium]
MDNRVSTAVLTGILALAVLPASAGAASLKDIRVNGFATVAGVASNSEGERINYLGADKSLSFDSDSKMGIQLTMPATEALDFTVQLVAKGSENYAVEAEWAFGAFAVNDWLTVRAGRLRIPFFRISNSLLVGYSYPWVRPPMDTYGQFAFSRFTGVDALLSVPLGSSTLVFHPHYGTSASDFEMMGMAGEFSVKQLLGMNITWNYDWISLRLGHTEGDYDVYGFTALEPLADIMYQFSGKRRVADQFAIRERHGQFTGFGVDIDYQGFKFLGEYNVRKTDGLMTDTSSWYVTFAYQFGKFLPHISWSQFRTDENYDRAMAAVPLIDLGDPDLTADVQGAFNQIIAFNRVNQQSLTAGLRYDFMPKTALKLEYQRIMPQRGSSLLSPPFEGSAVVYQGSAVDAVELYTVALDFVF